MFSLRLKFGWMGREEVQAGEEQEEQDWIDWIDELDRTQKSPAMDPNISLPPLAREYTTWLLSAFVSLTGCSLQLG